MWSSSSHLALVVLVVFGLLAGGPLSSAHAQIEELPRPDSAHAASFGVSVALGDSIAAVGVSGEPVCGDNAGAVYVYERIPKPQFDAWRVTTRLTPRDCRPGSFFGERISLSGSRLLVGASSEHFADESSNAAYVFDRDTTGAWHQSARFTGMPTRQEGLFATDIALDGNRAVVSTSGNPEGNYGGAVYVYDYNPATGEWTRSARFKAGRDMEARVFGQRVALHGNDLAVVASTYFQRSLGAVYVFRWEKRTETWREVARLPGIDSFLIDADLHGSILIVGEDRAGENNSGRATLYTARRDRTWQKVATLHPSLPYESGGFGGAVSLEDSWALVTGYDEQLDKEINIDRVVYVFRRHDSRRWRQHTILDIGQVDFGAALDQNGSMALISSVPADEPGAVYVIQLR